MLQRTLCLLTVAAAQLFGAANSPLLEAVLRRDFAAARALVEHGTPVDTMSLIIAESLDPATGR
ncbi:MAG TPA: hypothetical protein VES20_02615, partial [Bryobacteraceae bacterium]|nr:hypothetical protein [Bryobacteraceae bacterium]